MENVISATEARIHFGELMRQVIENGAPIVVEKAGKPQVVVLSVAEYERLQMSSETENPDRIFEDILAFADRIQVRKSGSMPVPEDMVRQGREIRDEQLLNNLP
ncbi:MAG: type II toxin-antitoxin system Phd/YefM family antitoxin [Chloroflexota bacterium]